LRLLGPKAGKKRVHVSESTSPEAESPKRVKKEGDAQPAKRKPGRPAGKKRIMTPVKRKPGRPPKKGKKSASETENTKSAGKATTAGSTSDTDARGPTSAEHSTPGEDASKLVKARVVPLKIKDTGKRKLSKKPVALMDDD
jgi:hypothetical protein